MNPLRGGKLLSGQLKFTIPASGSPLGEEILPTIAAFGARFRLLKGEPLKVQRNVRKEQDNA